MTPLQMFTSFYTIVRKDVIRMMRIWTQTFLPSVVTSVLYFAVFGTVIGGRIGEFNGFPYMAFIVPGLVMLAVVMNSFSNVAFTFFQGKFFARNIDEILVSPTPPWVMIAGYIGGGMFRGIIAGLMVILVAFFFVKLPILHVWAVVLFLILSSMIFALGGLINGIYAKSFDTISIIPTFVLTPLVYLGGVFYSTTSLPPLWQKLTYFDPIFYLINGFRYGFLGVTDIPLHYALAVLLILTVVLIGINWYLIKKGLGLRQ